MDDGSAAIEPADVEDPSSLQAQARLAWTECRYSDALGLLDSARRGFEAEGNLLLAMRTQLGRCNVLIDMGDIADAIGTAMTLRGELARVDTQAIAHDEQELLTWLKAASAENHGAALEVAGRHSAAVDVLNQSLELYSTAGSAVDRARVRASLGVQLLCSGSPDQALGELVAARDSFIEADDTWLGYRCLVYESRALAITGRYAQALDRLSTADRLIADTTTTGGDEKVTADALRGKLARAEVHLELNMVPEALAACTALLPVLQSKSLRPEIAACYHVEARARLANNNPTGASTACEAAIENWTSCGLDVHVARAKITLARCRNGTAQQPLINEAIEVLSEAGEQLGVAEAALVGAGLVDEDGQRLGSGQRVRYLDLAVTAGALGTPETAWRERWQRSLLEADSDARSEYLDESLAILRTLHGGLQDDFHRAPFMATRRDPLEARVGLHLIADEVDEAFSLSSRYRSAALGLNQTTPAISVDTTTLLYQSIGNRLYCFVALPDSSGGPSAVEVVDMGSVLESIDDLKIDLRAHWRHVMNPRLRARRGVRVGPTQSTLQTLHNLLFAQVDPLVPDGPIIIVPTGRIAGVPFAALYDGERYLIDERAVSMSPSIGRQGLGADRARSDAADATTLVVGVPDRLAPAVEAEAQHVARLTGGRLLLSETATVAATQAALPDASGVHLAGHSHFRSDNPWLSSFDFFDRTVTATELAAWDLHNKVAVLSSCSSAQQLNLGEDEMLGLPRALLMAGARDVLVNLWSVDDHVAGELMAVLYRELATEAPAQALRSAQVAIRGNFAHPYFWAPTVHYQSPIG